MSRFWSDTVHTLTPYTPGEQPQVEGLVKLNTNENPYGPSSKVLAAIAAANGDSLRKYPDPNGTQLKTAIAEHYGLETAQVFVGNSSDEVLAHVFRGLLKHDKALFYPDITYSFYPVYCRLFDIPSKVIPLREDFSINVDDYAQDNGGIIFANPNAPTGIALGLDKIDALLQRNTDSVVVIDEAYVDFSDESAVSLIEKHPNLLVTQTLSKSRSLAGLRVGLALGNVELIEGLERVKNSFHPYALDALALAGATAAFYDNDHFEKTRDKVILTRDAAIKTLSKLGFSALPSKTNFIFVRHDSHNADDLYNALRQRKILVRHFDTPRINQFLRISIGTDQEMAILFEALSEILT